MFKSFELVLITKYSQKHSKWLSNSPKLLKIALRIYFILSSQLWVAYFQCLWGHRGTLRRNHAPNITKLGRKHPGPDVPTKYDNPLRHTASFGTGCILLISQSMRFNVHKHPHSSILPHPSSTTWIQVTIIIPHLNPFNYFPTASIVALKFILPTMATVTFLEHKPNHITYWASPYVFHQ